MPGTQRKEAMGHWQSLWIALRVLHASDGIRVRHCSVAIAARTMARRVFARLSCQKNNNCN